MLRLLQRTAAQTLKALIVALLMAVAVSAQTAPDAAELTKLLNEFLAGASHNDAAVHDRFWAEDVIYTGSAGKRRGKAENMWDVCTAPGPRPGESTIVFTPPAGRSSQNRATAILGLFLLAKQSD